MRNAARPLRLHLEVWGRRLLTVPFYTLLCAFVVGALPLLLAIGAITDLVRGGPWVTIRCVVFVGRYFLYETAGVVATFVTWLASWLPGGRRRFWRWNFALQRWWACGLFHGAERIFGFRTEVEGADAVASGPIILFIRHTSIGDALLPAVFLSARHGLVLRYVLKRELLWDPCLDIVGNRLRNCFLRRGSGEGAREIAQLRRLMDDLGPTDGVLIYPEGTRFTAVKRQRALDRLRLGDARLLERARAFTHVLPPRLGGALALLDCNQQADAVFCAHVGFEGTASFRDLLRGALVNGVVRVCFWRAPFEKIPRGPAAQAEWLYEEWRRLDEWVGRNVSAPAC